MAADSVRIDFDSTDRPRIVNGVCRLHNYQAFVQQQVPGSGPPPQQVFINIPNPESKTQFAKRMIAEQVMIWVVAAEEADDHAAVPRRQKPQIT